jgi:lipopolysaccharide transport system ATP-binding protein
MSDSIIQVSNLGKRFEIGELGTASDVFRQGKRVIRNWLGRMPEGYDPRRPWETDDSDNGFWALKGIDFEVKEGEALGIIGRNGAGKSTMLKILSRITGPTTGRINIYGRVAALLEVGTGFHPELTGRENAYLNGAILGMNRREVRSKLDAIVDFAGVEKFLDTPVKRYSSGMRVRLGFAVAAHLEPEVLIVDEVLAVGDVQFQNKCIMKMQEIARSEGRTVLFVSHNMGTIQSLCTRALLLRDAKVVADDIPSVVVREYLRQLEEQTTVPLAERSDREGKGPVRIDRMEIAGQDIDAGLPVVHAGQSVDVVFHLNRCAADHFAAFALWTMDGQQLVSFDARRHTGWDESMSGSVDRLTCRIPEFLLVPGEYRVSCELFRGLHRVDGVEAATRVRVEEGNIGGLHVGRRTRGYVVMPHQWQTDEPALVAMGVAAGEVDA